MIKLYHGVLTRSVRIFWLLEELGLRYELERVVFTPPGSEGGVRSEKSPAHLNAHPLGKVPTIEDGEIALFESGAILEYILERHGRGRLAPPSDSPLRPAFLQWVHFAEATLQRALDEIFSQTEARPESERVPALAAEARERAAAAVQAVEQGLHGRDYLLGAEFSGADIMMGYTLLSAKYFGVVTDKHPNVKAYLERLVSRPALRKALT
jgi:glutathione S-transferase